MDKGVAVAVMLLLASATQATAQDVPTPSILLPGFVNATVGTPGPLEPGNVVGSATIEQGFALWRRGPLFVLGFVDITLRADSAGNAWNNTLPYVTGVKLMASGSRGVVQAALGVAGQSRDGSANALSRAAYVSYWAGWRRPATHVAFPGSVWASSGVAHSSEPDNWVTAAHLEQGVTTWRRRSVAIVPFAAITASIDTQGRRWNNRAFVDGGVKLTARLKGAALEVGMAHRSSREWHGHASAASPVVFSNVWLGWAPRLAR